MRKKTFFNLSDGVKKGKGVDAITDSRAGYNALLAMFGGVANMPSSIMRADKQHPDPLVDQEGHKRSYKETAPLKEKAKTASGVLKSAMAISGKGCAAGALSIFPQNVGRSTVLLYSNPGDTVFDPFAGHNSRMDLVVKAGRNYIGCDLCKEFMAFNRKRAEKLRRMFPGVKIDLHEGDSRKIPVKDAVGDFTITCYDEKTEVLTEAGWKNFADVTYEDRIATLNRQTNAIEYQQPTDITSSPYAGPMLQVTTPFINLNVTPNHNMYVKRKHDTEYKLIQARDLPPKAGYKFKADGDWQGEEREWFDLPGVEPEGSTKAVSESRLKKYQPARIPMDAFLEFLGYWLSEGSLQGRPGHLKGEASGSVVLTTASVIHRNKFQKAIKAMGLLPPRTYKQGGIYRVVVHDRRLWVYLYRLGYSGDKYVPRDLLGLSKRQLTILFNAMMVGDGAWQGNRYWTVSSRLRDDVMELCFKLGYGASHSAERSIKEQRVRHLNGKLIKSNLPCWTVHIRRERPNIHLSPGGWKEDTKCFRGWVDYVGMVRCVTVPNRVIYVRREGKAVWCGNSPPYWDIEHYGDEPEQMENCRTYEEFLAGMQSVMNENFRALKPGAYAAWFINDFRKRDVMHFYHIDILQLGEAAGFTAHDIMVVDLGRGFRDCFPNQTMKQKILPKRHEFGVIFRKPLPKKKETDDARSNK